MRKKYLPLLHQEKEESTSEKLKNQQVILHCDETTDRMGRAVFIVLFRTLPKGSSETPKLLVGGVVMLQNANSQECSQAIVEVLNRHKLEYKNIIGISTDGARYMKKCVQTLKGLISDNLLHIECWAHKLDLVAGIWPKKLHRVNECVTKTKQAFLNTRKRKHKYIRFLQQKYGAGEKDIKLFPSPVITRWNTWFASVSYLADYVMDLVEYFKTVDSDAESVKYFQKLSESEVKAILCEAIFVKEHCASTSETITCFEGSYYALAHKVVPKVNELISEYMVIEKLVMKPETLKALNELSSDRKKSVEKRFVALANACHTKLSDMLAKDSACKIFNSLSSLFHLPLLRTVNIESSLFNKIEKIPLFTGVNSHDFLKFYIQLQITCKSFSYSEGNVVEDVLKGMVEEYPIAVKCLQSLYISISNVDSERALSAYNDILSDKRTNLSSDNLETLLSYYFNSK